MIFGKAAAIAGLAFGLITNSEGGSLPDTGITASQCYRAGSDVLVSCTSPEATALNARQDGMVGRDVTNPDNGDGKLGFSYSAVSGGCVKDNLTGLIWEVKTNDGGLRDWGKAYTNYGDGRVGDASAFVTAVNAKGLCGYTDWRLPTADELQGIIDYGVAYPGPTLDITWFPNTQGGIYWSSTPFVDNAGNAWSVDFYDGHIDYSLRAARYSVRLVR
jgi:hypothetical protein